MPQNCKSPTYWQRFIITIKNVTERKKKKLKSLIRFHSTNKKTTTMEGVAGAGWEKFFLNPKESTEQVKTEEE